MPAKPRSKRSKKGEGDEESELIQASSDEEVADDGELASVSTTPPMKPVITDRYVNTSTKLYHTALSVIVGHFLLIYPTGTTFTFHILRESPVFILRAGGKTRGEGYTMPT